MGLHSSNNLTMTETGYYILYCATPGEKQSKQPMKISTITTYFLFMLDVHSSKNQTRVEIRSFTSYCANSG